MSVGQIVRAIAETGRISVPTLWDASRGRLTPEVADERLLEWSRRLLEHAQAELDIHYHERARAVEACVVMSNHQSLYDIPVLYQTLRRRLRMVAKEELFKVPIWGSAMRTAGFVSVDRGDRDKAIASMKHAEQAIAAGTSIWVAPEGTRSPTGQLGKFKKGGFHLALATGAPILPISIDGTRNILPARGWRITTGMKVRVVVHEPVDPSGYTEARIGDLMHRVRRVIESELPGS
jgi:1-acyl-sn-glycerol-3-phosphate acyltransferase